MEFLVPQWHGRFFFPKELFCLVILPFLFFTKALAKFPKEKGINTENH